MKSFLEHLHRPEHGAIISPEGIGICFEGWGYNFGEEYIE